MSSRDLVPWRESAEYCQEGVKSIQIGSSDARPSLWRLKRTLQMVTVSGAPRSLFYWCHGLASPHGM